MSAADALPEPDFDVLVQVLAMPCYVHLGLVDNPASGRPEKDLGQARWAIDLLHVLRERTQTSLSAAERERLDTLLHRLRDAYLAARR